MHLHDFPRIFLYSKDENLMFRHMLHMERCKSDYITILHRFSTQPFDLNILWFPTTVLPEVKCEIVKSSYMYVHVLCLGIHVKQFKIRIEKQKYLWQMLRVEENYHNTFRAGNSVLLKSQIDDTGVSIG